MRVEGGVVPPRGFALCRPSHFATGKVVRCLADDGRIFAMQHRHACMCGHGTGGGGTITPPLGTCTHR
jgi:hypothetical protein